MSRIRKLKPTEWDADLCRQFHADDATDLELGLMRMFAHRPSIAKGIVALGCGIKADMSLPPRLVELDAISCRMTYHGEFLAEKGKADEVRGFLLAAYDLMFQGLEAAAQRSTA